MNQALEPLLDVIRREPGIALIAAVAAYLLLFALTIYSTVRYTRLERRQSRLLRGADGSSLQQMLLDQIDGSAEVRGRISDAADRGKANSDQIRLCLQKIGVVRFDAFPDVGGEQSFALALLDADDSGVVLSGLFSRHHMRVYAKPIDRGGAPQPLTTEEKQAIAASQYRTSTGKAG